MKIKKDDNVMVISGKDRKKTGKVLRSLPKENRILVEGVNIRKKHARPRRQGEKGQIVSLSAPIPVSNVKLICPKCSAAVRIGYRIEGKQKFRICKKCKSVI